MGASKGNVSFACTPNQSIALSIHVPKRAGYHAEDYRHEDGRGAFFPHTLAERRHGPWVRGPRGPTCHHVHTGGSSRAHWGFHIPLEVPTPWRRTAVAPPVRPGWRTGGPGLLPIGHGGVGNSTEGHNTVWDRRDGIVMAAAVELPARPAYG